MENIATAPKLVRVRSRGQLTIPQDMREALSLDESTGLNIFRVGKVLIMSPKRLQRTSLANGVEREIQRPRCRKGPGVVSTLFTRCFL